MVELMVPVVTMLHPNDDAAALAPTTFGDLKENLDIVPRKSQRSQGTSRLGISHMSLDSGKQQSHKQFASLQPEAATDASLTHNVKPIDSGCYYPCI